MVKPVASKCVGAMIARAASHTVTTVEIVTENGKNMFIGRRVM